MSTISNELFLLNELEKKYSTHISYLKDISYNPTGKRDFIEIVNVFDTRQNPEKLKFK